MPVLIKLMSMTVGNVLEIGTGIYSTPFLHWVCLLQGRKLVSIENNNEYMEFAEQFTSDTHKIEKEAPLDGEWDIVFIDSFPVEDRLNLAKKYAKTAKYIVVHDISREDFVGIFKYRLDYFDFYPNTSIFSNDISLDNMKV